MKKIIIIGILVLVIIALVLVFFLVIKEKTAAEEPGTIEGQPTPTFSTEEQTILALKNKDPSYCDVFSNQERKNVCLSDYLMVIALKKVDESKCEEIPLKSISKTCLAVIEKDKNKCNNIQDEWEKICLQFIAEDIVSALKGNSFDFCEKVEGLSTTYCKSLVKAVS